MDTCAFLDGIDFSASLDTVDARYYNGNSVGRATALRIVLDRTTPEVQVRKLHGRSVEFPVIHPAWAGTRHTVGFGVGDDIDDPNHWTPPQVKTFVLSIVVVFHLYLWLYGPSFLA